MRSKKYRRSKTELYMDILRAISNGRHSPSHIVYAANLSYDRVIRCILFLEEQKLVRKINEEKNRYEITEGGIGILQYFNHVESTLFYEKKFVSTLRAHHIKN